MRIKDYKPYIDGLRALAVLPVILFHANFKFFEGGYIGVDIFFVISGYLITNIIIKDLSVNKFNLKNFYLRRARRILPILYFITIISLLASFFLMSDEEIIFFSRQIISVILFFSNFFFWKNTGYFDPSTETQPLLHTWSLGVEEQFYILFPLFLIFLWKLYRNKIFISFIIVSLLSLILSQIGGNFKIQNLSYEFPYFKLPFDFFWQAGSANFYLPFGRVWELLTGSLISIFLNKRKIKEKKFNSFLSFLGIVLILISIFTFKEDTQYPSVFTILPVAGTSLLIIFSTSTTIAHKLLSWKPLVFLGLISFSLYLWHQPLLAFNRIYFGVDLNFYHKIIIIILSFIFSILTWKFIENPFRNKKKIDNRKVVIILLSTSFAILLISILISFSKISSFKEQLPKKISNTFKSEDPNDCFDLEYAHLSQKKWYCEIGQDKQEISFALIGDSHALALKPAFELAAKTKNKKGVFTGFSGCPGLIGINSLRSDSNIKNCKLLNDKLFEFVKKNKIKKIFLASRWNYYTVGNYAKTNFNFVSKDQLLFSNKTQTKLSTIYGIKNTLKRYKDINVEVVFVHQVPEQIYKPKYAYQQSIMKNTINIKKLSSFAVSYKKHMKHSKFIRDNVNNIKKDFFNLKQIDFDNIFCNKIRCNFGSESVSYYSDRNHLSTAGSLKVVDVIKKMID